MTMNTSNLGFYPSGRLRLSSFFLNLLCRVFGHKWSDFGPGTIVMELSPGVMATLAEPDRMRFCERCLCAEVDMPGNRIDEP